MASFEGECVEVRCRLSEIIQTNEDPSSFENSCMGLQTFNSPESTGQSSLTVTKTTKRSGDASGYTCGVPTCFNNKRNPELSFYNFPNEKTSEAKERRKKFHFDSLVQGLGAS